MDPLSMTASIVTLLGVVEALGIGLHKVISLKDVPAILLALNNEISELHILFHELDSVLHEHGRLKDARWVKLSTEPGLASLPRSLEHAKAKLQDLQDLLQNRIIDSKGNLDRIAWLREGKRVRKLQEELRAARLNITTALGIMTSSSSFRVQMQLQDLQMLNAFGNVEIIKAFMLQTKSLERSSAKMTSVHEMSEKRFDRLEEHLIQISKQVQQHNSKTLSMTDTQKLLTDGRSRKPIQPHRMSSFGALQMRFRQSRKCEAWCPCVCHKQHRLQTPSLLNFIFGSLFIGYSGVPALRSACNVNVCKGVSDGYMQLNYFFPPWFLARVVSMAILLNPTNGPEMCLRAVKLRDAFDPIFKSCLEGDVNSVKSMLTSGKASVLDVSEDSGHSPLHLAMRTSRLGVIRVLLQFGADFHMENSSYETPYDMAWSSILCFQGTGNSALYEVDELLELFPSPDICEERRKFTRLHKIILKLLHIDLEQELRMNHNLVDQVDSDSRSPLHWAAARGDSYAVQLLLHYGADTNLVDRIHQGPLRSSLKAEDPLCMKLLIEAGAKIEQRDNWKQTCLQAAMYYPNPEGFIRPLLEAGAEVNVQDHLGCSPLSEAIKGNHAGAVRILHHYGARLTVQDSIGCTPFHYGIRYNAYEAMEVLLSFEFDHSVEDDLGQNPLHVAAEVADARMLYILARARLKYLEINYKDNKGKTPLDLAKARNLEISKLEEKMLDKDTALICKQKEWDKAWTHLVESIKSSRTSSGQAPSNDLNEDSDASHESWQSAADYLATIV